MPSRFEALPDTNFVMTSPAATARARRRATRYAADLERRLLSQWPVMQAFNGMSWASMERDYWYMLRRGLIRMFGLITPDDRSFFANVTGRLQWIQRAMFRAVDRRRRQAYLLLRQLLPEDLAGAIVTRRMPATHASWRPNLRLVGVEHYGIWRRGEVEDVD